MVFITFPLHYKSPTLRLDRPIPVREAQIPAPQRRVDPLRLAVRRQPVKDGEVLLGQLDDLLVGRDALLGDGLGQNDDTLVDVVGDQDGGGRDAELLGDLLDFGVGHEGGACYFPD